MAGSKPSMQGLSEKVKGQLTLIIDAFGTTDPEVHIGYVRSGDGLDFLYQEGYILVADDDLQPVWQIVRPPVRGRRRRGEEGPVVSRVIRGLLLLSLKNTRFRGTGREGVLGALGAIDGELGTGVATPNHVLYIVPGGTCPASEPEEVGALADPVPGVCCEKDGRDVSILIGDSGLLSDAQSHSWLVGVQGEPEQADPADIPAYAGHGTFVAGVARCMAPATNVYVADIFDTAHQGGAVLEVNAIKRLTALLVRDPDIISLSAVATTRLNIALKTFDVFFRQFHNYKGMVFVAAAGNDSEWRRHWPAAFPEVVSVGALSEDRRHRAGYSNYGAWVDVYAPGTRLVNAFATGTYICKEHPYTGRVRNFTGMAIWSGTSFSTPLVAGLIAARMSRTGENGRQAADSLLAKARAQAIPGVGAVLRPCLDENDGTTRA